MRWRLWFRDLGGMGTGMGGRRDGVFVDVYASAHRAIRKRNWRKGFSSFSFNVRRSK